MGEIYFTFTREDFSYSRDFEDLLHPLGLVPGWLLNMDGCSGSANLGYVSFVHGEVWKVT